jgi:hypothetical protein
LRSMVSFLSLRACGAATSNFNAGERSIPLLVSADHE